MYSPSNCAQITCRFFSVTLLLLLASLLTSCSSVNYANIATSTAQISQLNVHPSGTPYTGRHRVNVSFDYHIDNYHEQAWLYSCNVIFTFRKQQVVASSYKRNNYCRIDTQQGTLTFARDTPLSTTSSYHKTLVDSITLPLQFYVVIQQQTAEQAQTIIGKSEPMYLGNLN